MNLPYRCLSCSHEASDFASACPACGFPADLLAAAGDVQLRINLQELRIIAEWASGWVRQYPAEHPARAALACILDRLEAQRPAESAPLTLRRASSLHPGAVMWEAEGERLPAVLYPRRTIS